MKSEQNAHTQSHTCEEETGTAKCTRTRRTAAQCSHRSHGKSSGRAHYLQRRIVLRCGIVFGSTSNTCPSMYAIRIITSYLLFLPAMQCQHPPLLLERYFPAQKLNSWLSRRRPMREKKPSSSLPSPLRVASFFQLQLQRCTRRPTTQAQSQRVKSLTRSRSGINL